MQNKKSGFTLIELLVAVAIVAILTGVTIIGLTSVRQKGQDTVRLAGIREVQIALEAFKSVNGKYAASLNELAPAFIQKVPVDPQGEAGSTGFLYSVSSDLKSYCMRVKGTVAKASSQPDLVDTGTPNSWKACKGADIGNL
jgi:prepilin-type N-terminal cleavage/methylation domain-containing protein